MSSSDSSSIYIAPSSSSSLYTITSNLNEVRHRIDLCLDHHNRSEDSVQLVAVSKTKPVECLLQAYDAGQRHFGENYSHELISKASMMAPDVKWHFIGALQSNKVASLVKHVGLNGLVCVETVSTRKLARKLDLAAAQWVQDYCHEDGDESETDDIKKKLGIYIQMNTSGEGSKSGVESVEEAVELATEIVRSCPYLSLDGLMTIGAPGDSSCFDDLAYYRGVVARALDVEEYSLELSMGMSGDFEEAIARGATSVRVGSTIFGQREYSNEHVKRTLTS